MSHSQITSEQHRHEGEHPACQGEAAPYTFFALVMRTRYIERWMLMRNSQPENLAEHSLDVAMMAHALCTIANIRYGAHLDANRAAVLGLYHDAPEIITGDLPTPVKYFNEHTRTAYAEAEASAVKRLVATLPADIRPVYEDLLGTPKAPRVQASDSCGEASGAGEQGDADVDELSPLSDVDSSCEELRLRREVKAADKISALLKCLQEKSTGNTEFRSAEETTRASLDKMAQTMPEVRDFLAEFLPSFEATLDELLR